MPKPTLKYPLDLVSMPLSNYIQFTEYTRTSRKASTIGQIIGLYMPENVQNSATLSWDTGKLDAYGGLIQGALSQGNVDDAYNYVMNNAGGAFVSKAATTLAGKAAGMIGSNIDGTGVLGTVFQKIPNPFLTMIFRGVDFRTFEFTFKLYPHSKKEANEIHKIIKAFRAAAYPEKASENDTPWFLKYPSEFEIEYHFIDENVADQVNTYLNKYKRSVITAVDVNYTAQGMFSIHRDGFPTVISLTIRFSEIEILLRNDIEEGY